MTGYVLRKAQANAKKIGVEVKPSKRKGKKLDVFKGGVKVASIGDSNYDDFTRHGNEDRRRSYKKRHQATRTKVGSPSYYADKILWE
jgi:hypothetical protein